MADWTESLERGEVRDVTPCASNAAAVALQRCASLAEELARRCRAWCAGEGVTGHTSLEIACGLALAIAAEGVRDEQLLRHELLLRARRCDTPEGLLGIEAAAVQLLAFLESGPMTGRSSLFP